MCGSPAVGNVRSPPGETLIPIFVGERVGFVTIAADLRSALASRALGVHMSPSLDIWTSRGGAPLLGKSGAHARLTQGPADGDPEDPESWTFASFQPSG